MPKACAPDRPCQPVPAGPQEGLQVRPTEGKSGSWPTVWEAGDGFADGDLCVSCALALGDQQWRAFHNLGPFHEAGDCSSDTDNGTVRY